MRKNKVIGVLLLILALYTFAGMALDNVTFWDIYNYLVIIFSLVSGIVLLRQK